MTSPEERSARWARWLVPIVPALVTAGKLGNGLVLDDTFVIERGSVIHDVARLPEALMSHTMFVSSMDAAIGQPSVDTYRPVAVLTFFVDAAWSGRDPLGYHLTNTILHCLVVALVQSLLLRTATRRWWVAALAGLGFGLSPVIAEAHVWINGRSDLLCASFGVGAILVVGRGLVAEGARRAHSLFAAGALLWLLALGSKEVLLGALPLVAAIPTTHAVPRVRRAWALGYAAAATASYLAIRVAVLSGLRTHAGADQLYAAALNLPVLFADAFVHVVVPSEHHLRSLRDDYAALAPAVRVAAAAFTALLGAIVAGSARRRSVIPFGAALAAATLLPVAMITTVLWPGFGRYLYLPAIGIFLAIAGALDALLDARPAVARSIALVGSGYAMASAVLLAVSVAAFASDESLYADAISNAPDQAFGHGFLGLARRRSHRCSDAIPELLRATELDPEEPRYALALGHCLVDVGEPERASALAARERARHRGTRVEAGFLFVAVRADTTGDRAHLLDLLDRCLALDAGRSDCRAARLVVAGQP